MASPPCYTEEVGKSGSDRRRMNLDRDEGARGTVGIEGGGRVLAGAGCGLRC
jgi:hypothetical protein